MEKRKTVKTLKNDLAGRFTDAPESSEEQKTVPWYKKPLLKKISFWLIAIIVAMSLWGYVLMSENPAREKKIDGVHVSFEAGSEADLAARNLVVRGDISDIIPAVSVTVETTLNDLQRFNTARDASDIINATVSLRNVNRAGEYTLDITATSTIGSVIDVSPSTVVVYIDELVTRMVPINYTFSGELPDGYWMDTPSLSTPTVSIRGAKGDIQRAEEAVCVIPLNECTESINRSFELELYDSNNKPIDDSASIGSLPSVIVSMTVLPCTEIRITPDIIGHDLLHDIYEVSEVTVQPETLKVACSAKELATLSETVTTIPSINVGNYREAGIYTFTVTLDGLPENAEILSENSFTVTVKISEKIETQTFEAVPVTIIDENAAAYSYEYNTLFCDVVFTGNASVIRMLRKKNITLSASVFGLAVGKHELTPEFILSDTSMMLNLKLVSITPISVTVSKKPTA